VDRLSVIWVDSKTPPPTSGPALPKGGRSRKGRYERSSQGATRIVDERLARRRKLDSTCYLVEGARVMRIRNRTVCFVLKRRALRSCAHWARRLAERTKAGSRAGRRDSHGIAGWPEEVEGDGGHGMEQTLGGGVGNAIGDYPPPTLGRSRLFAGRCRMHQGKMLNALTVGFMEGLSDKFDESVFGISPAEGRPEWNPQASECCLNCVEKPGGTAGGPRRRPR